MVLVLEIVLVAVIVFAVAAFAVSGLGTASPAPPDSGASDLPGGRVRAGAVDRVRFSLVFRGYKMSQVDEVLDRLRDEIAERDERLAALGGALDDDPGPLATTDGTEPGAGAEPGTSDEPGTSEQLVWGRGVGGDA